MWTHTERIDRRSFLETLSASVALGGLAKESRADQRQPSFQISLNESSCDRSLTTRTIDHLSLARIARHEFEIGAVEYVSRYFQKDFTDEYLTEMNRRAAEYGVLQLLIVVDGEGKIGNKNPHEREKALDNHRKWIHAAKALGCHSIQIDPTGTADRDQQLHRTADSLLPLLECAAEHKINILLGQRGGPSCDAAWLVDLVDRVDRENCGVMPRFAGFGGGDRYAAMKQLAPLAKGISASSADFDEQGNEKHTDFHRMMKLIVASGYRGYVGIEYVGKQLEERIGIRKTVELLNRVRKTLS